MCRNQLTLQANCQSKYLLIPTVTCAQVRLEAVEIDGEMSKVASDWFGFHHNDNVTVHIADGLHFISQLATRGGNVGLFVSIAHWKSWGAPDAGWQRNVCNRFPHTCT